MALVPFRVSGRAADQALEERLMQFGPHLVTIEQDPTASRETAAVERRERGGGEEEEDETISSESREASLGNVGKVVWQSGFLLADYLIGNPPFREWSGVRVIDLGTGTGVIGIALAKAGANVLFTDLAHIIPWTSANIAKNGLSEPQCRVAVHHWGASVDDLQPLPDVITGGDLLYAPGSHAALLETLADLSAPHTIVYLAYRTRGDFEGRFLQQLSERGFVIRHVPIAHYHPEYQEAAEGMYQILEVRKQLIGCFGKGVCIGQVASSMKISYVIPMRQARDWHFGGKASESAPTCFWSLFGMRGKSVQVAVMLITMHSTLLEAADVSCEACLQVADKLSGETAAMETEPTFQNDLVGEVRPRRRLMHTRSEPDIFSMLDTICGREFSSRNDGSREACNSLLPTHKDDLENYIFDRGADRLKAYLCSDLSGACLPHQLSDSQGEL